MSKDTIYRQAAIDEMEEYWRSLNLRRKRIPLAAEAVYMDLKGVVVTLPSAQSEQQWIPCSERLPEAQTEVIVSCTDDSGDTKFRYTTSGWITTNKEYWIVDNEINPFVVAWMPLPLSYQEEQE